MDIREAKEAFQANQYLAKLVKEINQIQANYILQSQTHLINGNAHQATVAAATANGIKFVLDKIKE